MQDLQGSLARRQALEIERDGLINEMDREIAAIREHYGQDMASATLQIVVEEKLQLSWLAAHKADFDGPPRSIDLPSGTIGYRLGQPRLSPLSKWTWDKVLKHMLEQGINNFIRRTPEVDREALLAQKDDFGADGLKAIGLRVVQDDKPFVEIKREDTDATKAAAGGAEA